MYAVINVSKVFMREWLRCCVVAFKNSLSQTANKNSNEFKNPMTPDPFVSDVKVSPAKSSNKGYGDKNSFREVQGKLEFLLIGPETKDHIKLYPDQ